MKTNGPDEMDNRILEMLRGNGRLSHTEIGEKLGMTRTAVKKRIDALEKAGIITGYQVNINPVALPETLTFYAYIETKTEAYDATIQQLKLDPCVTYLSETVGNNALLMICHAKDKDERNAFRQRITQNYGGITYFTVKDIWKVDKGVLA